jgi:hypothetical protein
VRRVEQPQQRRRLLLGAGLGVEVVARQVGEAELVLGRELPGQVEVDLGASAARLAISSAGAGLSKRSSTLAAFTFTRLPESSSICTELSASDITRPARNLPASSNNA